MRVQRTPNKNCGSLACPPPRPSASPTYARHQHAPTHSRTPAEAALHTPLLLGVLHRRLLPPAPPPASASSACCLHPPPPPAASACGLRLLPPSAYLALAACCACASAHSDSSAAP